MGFLKGLFGKNVPPPAEHGMDQHLVRLQIPLSSQFGESEEREGYMALEDVLDEAARKAGLGELDGNEIGGNEYTIWLYGPNATALAEVVRKTALQQNLPPGCTLFLRHGGVNDPAAREETLSLI